MMNRFDIHKELCEKLNATYKAKNADYGNSFAEVREKYQNAILVRLNDKLKRLETLMGGSMQQVADESIDDTLLDLANYAIMELVERKCERPTAEQPQHTHCKTTPVPKGFGKPVNTINFRESYLLSVLSCGYIARDEDGSLYWYDEKPCKKKYIGRWDAKEENEDDAVIVHLQHEGAFPFIKWEDEEPWDVEKIQLLPTCGI